MCFELLQRYVANSMVRSLLALCALLGCVLAGSPVQAESGSLTAPAVGIAVVPASMIVREDEVFTLELWVYPHGQEVDVVDADMSFNPTQLEVLSVTGDPAALPIELHSAFSNVAGTVTHSRGILIGTAPSTDFRLCSIELRAKATVEGTTLAFTDLTGAFCGGEPVETETTDATLTITLPVGGVARLPDPGRLATRLLVKLAGLSGVMLGAAVTVRKLHGAGKTEDRRL